MKNELENITANQTPMEIALGFDKFLQKKL